MYNQGAKDQTKDTNLIWLASLFKLNMYVFPVLELIYCNSDNIVG